MIAMEDLSEMVIKSFQERSYAVIRESRPDPPRGQSFRGAWGLKPACFRALMGIYGPIGISFPVNASKSLASMTRVELHIDELISSYWTDRHSS
jgi:hypothetical protein